MGKKPNIFASGSVGIVMLWALVACLVCPSCDLEKGIEVEKGKYVVIDLSAGPDAERYPYREVDGLVNPQQVPAHELWLRQIPKGTFMMGNTGGKGAGNDEYPVHQVELTQDFYIGMFPVLQRQWELVMGNNPSSFKNAGPTAPVEKVSYDDICGPKRLWPKNGDDSVTPDSFLGRLRARTGLKFDLPTEAQWEYACRAGTTTDLNSGKNLTSGVYCPNMEEVAWFSGNSGGTTHPVGQKQPNRWGLYDMHGNVHEWCRDWYLDDKYYRESPARDPVGQDRNTRWAFEWRVHRGGGWNEWAGYGCSSRRHRDSTGCESDRLGFRLFLQSVQR